ncbi:MAG: YigZ family protein, partial [Ginsengibacter sp.]
SATSLALQLTPIVQKQVEIIYSLEFDYTQMNSVMTIVKQYNCTILQQESQLFCLLKIGVPKNRETEVLYSLKELKGVEITEEIKQ